MIQLGSDVMEPWKKNYRPLHLASQGSNSVRFLIILNGVLFQEIISYLLIVLVENIPNFQLDELTEDGRDPLDLALEFK